MTGHPEIWLTLRSVAEITQSSLANQAAGRQGSGDRGHRLALHLPGGRHKDEGGTLGSELATAQSMLDAAGITLPSGDLADGVYDESGGYYQLPAEIIADPPGLIEDRPPPVNSLMSSSTIGTDGRESTSSLVEPDQPRKGSPKPTARGEKAAGLLSPAGAIGSPVEPASPAEERLFVKMRLSERGGKDLGIRIEKSRPVGELIKMMREEAKLSADVKIRLAYSGRILQEHQSLVSQGWKEGHVVNAMVFAGD